jgi:hypothetical protein
MDPARDRIRSLLITNSQNHNFNTLSISPAQDIVDALKKIASKDPDSMARELVLVKNALPNEDIALIAVAELSKSRLKPTSLNKIFELFIANILQLRRLAEILIQSSPKRTITGPIEELIRKRLCRLSEKDIALYYSQPDLDYQVALEDLLLLLKPEFKNKDIELALKWLSKQDYNGLTFAVKFRQLSILSSIANEPNISKIQEFLEFYKYEWQPVLTMLAEIAPELLTPAIKLMSKKDVSDNAEFLLSLLSCKGVVPDEYALEILKPSYQTGLWETFPYSVFWNSIFDFDCDHIPIPNKPIKSLYAFIDVSGATLSSYKEKTIAQSENTTTLLESILKTWYLLRSTHQREGLFIFDKIFSAFPWHKNAQKTAINILHRKEYLLGDITIPLEAASEKNNNWDCILIFTNYGYHQDLVDQWEVYRGIINPKAKLILIQFEPYNFNDIILPDGFYRILGWNEKAVRAIQNILRYL